jgi:hypothetical protein
MLKKYIPKHSLSQSISGSRGDDGLLTIKLSENQAFNTDAYQNLSKWLKKQVVKSSVVECVSFMDFRA